MGIEVKQSPGAGLLHCRTMIIEIRMQYLNYSKGRFEQRRRLVQRVQQLLFVGLCQKRNNQNLVLLGPGVGVRFECLRQFPEWLQSYNFPGFGRLKFLQAHGKLLLDLRQQLLLPIHLQIAEIIQRVLGMINVHITIIQLPNQGLYLLNVPLSYFIMPWVCSMVLAASGWFAFEYL